MFTALKTVLRDVFASRGSSISRQRSARNQLDNTPATMLKSTQPQRHTFRLSINSVQSIPLKQNHNSATARSSDRTYFNIFLKSIFIIRTAGKVHPALKCPKFRQTAKIQISSVRIALPPKEMLIFAPNV